MSGPGRKKIDGWEFWKTCRGFLDGKTITSKGLGMRVKREKNGIGKWKLEIGREKFQASVG
jgi:hypothetical protein